MNSIIDLALRAKAEQLLFRTWGNFSERVNEDTFLITPSGFDYDNLHSYDLSLIFQGKKTGLYKPSSESPMHQMVYELFPDVKVIMHTHQPYASAISLANDFFKLNRADALDLNSALLPIAPYALPSTGKLHSNVTDTLKVFPAKALLLKKHGALILGESYEDVLSRAIRLEQICKEIYQSIIGEKEVPPTHFYSMRKETIRFFDHEEECTEPVDADIYRKIYQERKDIHVIIPVKNSDLEVFYDNTLYPYLDDFAQNVGIKANQSSKHNVVLMSHSAYVLGSDRQEAMATKHILEKNAKAARIAIFYGEKPISSVESKLMNTIYQKKYSKLKNEN